MGFFKHLFSSPVFKVAAPIALGLALPGLGTALAGATGLGTTAATGLAGALGGGAIGGLEGGGLKGIGTGAVLGGLGGAIQGAGGLGSLLGTAATDGSAGTGILGALGPVGTGISNVGGALKSGLSTVGTGIESALGISPSSGMSSSGGIGSMLTGGGANITAPSGTGTGILPTASAYGPEGFALNPGSYGSAVGSLAKNEAPASGLLGKLLSNPSSLLSAGANIYSGASGVNAANDMADAQLQSTNAALAQQAQQFGQTQANMAPYQAVGATAAGNLNNLLSGDPAAAQAALEATPGYQFQLQQGTKAMNQGLAAKGSLFSGDALKAAQQFGQGLASTNYNNIVGQNQAALNSGQSGALGLGSLGANNAAINSQLLSSQGDVKANQINNSNNAINQSLSNLLGLKQYDIYGRPLRMSAYGAGA